MRRAKPNKYRVQQKPRKGRPEVELCQGSHVQTTFDLREGQRKGEERTFQEEVRESV